MSSLRTLIFAAITFLMKRTAPLLLLAFALACSAPNDQTENVDGNSGETKKSEVHYANETHFKSVRKLTDGGDNAEAYWSFAGDQLVFQVSNEAWGFECDQIMRFDPFKDDLMQSRPALISTGNGRTTCSYFLPGDTTILYASTHLGDSLCPPKPEKRADGKYVWPIYPSFDIFVTDINGEQLSQLTFEDGYDAEATVSPLGDRIVFTSMRTGDLELFTMDLDGSNVVQITDELGYDGGAFFSPDGSKLIFRASRPKTDEDVATYKSLLAEGLVMPTDMELFICNADGSNLRQITQLGGANWSPFFHPAGEKVVFSSNHASKKGFPFNLYMIDVDGNNLEQLSYDGVFDAFPVFSPNGKYLIFSSNRDNGGTHDTNLFLSEWK